MASAGRSLAVFVGNLNWTVSQGELRNYFMKFGPVVSSKIIFRNDGWSRGYGFVTFSRRDVFNRVLNHNDHYLEGKLLTVNPLETATDRMIQGESLHASTELTDNE